MLSPRAPIRFLPYLARRYLLRERHLVARSRYFDLRLRFRAEDAVGRHIYKYGVHEEALTRFLIEDVAFRPGDVVFDVGAHIGWYSLLLDRLLPPDGRVYALEPDPENFEMLQENVRLNGARKVTPLRRAVSDRRGTRWLYRYPSKNLGRHSLHPVHDGGRVRTKATTLDRLRRALDVEGRVPRLLKIDVEGHEEAVLRGAPETLRACPVVITEHAPGLLGRAGLEPDGVFRVLLRAGFRPHRLEPDGAVPADPETLLRQPTDAEIVWLRPSPDAVAGREGDG